MKKIYITILFISQLTFGQSLVLDSSFITGTGFNLWSGSGSITVNRVVQQPDNKIIVVGQYINYNGTTSNCITRLNADGTKDTTFNTGTGTNAGIWGCILQSDGKIIIYGGFTSYNGVSSNRIVRLNSNGTKDTSFAIGTGPSDFIESAKIQADGKIIMVGRFTSYNGVSINRIARVNTNGSLDTSFNVGLGADNRIRDLIIQADGKVIIGGDFDNYNGVAKRRIVRLNIDGSIDSSYNIGTGALSNIWIITLQNDNKILIGGDFGSYNGIVRNRIARINADGTLDTSFTVGTGANGTVMSIYVQSDNKIYIGGAFTTYNNVSRIRFARLNSDGTIDSSITIGNGFDNWVTSISKQSDNKLLIGGNFTTYNDVLKNRVIRLNDTTLENEDIHYEDFAIYPNPTESKLFIKNSDSIDYYKITSIDGKLIEYNRLIESYINVENLEYGIYILTLYKGETKIYKKFIKK